MVRWRLVASITAAFWAGELAAQSYGTGDQGLVIGAAAFVGQNANLEGRIGPDGYLYQPNFLSTFSAPVSLPDGAVITQICLYSQNFKQGATLHLQLEAVKLPGAGQVPAVVPIPTASVTADFIGYNFACTGPLSYTFHDLANVGGGLLERIAHRVSVDFTPLDDTLGLGGVRIVWHRQVTPPPASPTFLDVPASNTFFAYIEALAASEITGGCGVGNYCPNSPLTRGQMAVFLAKALGLQWPL